MGAKTDVSRWILDLLAVRGIDTVFGIPGVHTIDLYRALADHRIRHVTPRHEQGAGFMADGYARVSGRPAACFIITGPGLTNIATAMGQAYAESTPMLVISSASARRHMQRGLGHLHELRDQQALMAGVSAFSYTLQALEDLPAVLDRAFAGFAGARPRPVHIEIPLDLWQSPPDAFPLREPVRFPATRADDAAVDAAVGALIAAQRPLILAGGGVRDSAGALRELAEKLDAPVVMTVNARGTLPVGHALAVPASPSLPEVRALIADADVVLAVGTEMGATDYDMYERGMPAFPGRLIRVDIDPAQMTQPSAADVALVGDCALTIKAMLACLGGSHCGHNDGAERASKVRDSARNGLSTAMQRALDMLDAMRDALPEAILVGDSTHPIYAGNLYFEAARPRSWFNSSTGYGTLGFALPASLGAALAEPERPVVCIVGDGGLHFTLGELASIREQNRPVIILLWDNAGYGEIERSMVAEGIKPVGVKLFSPDFSALARAYGFEYQTASDVAGLCQSLVRAVGARKPTIIHVDEQTMVGDFD